MSQPSSKTARRVRPVLVGEATRSDPDNTFDADESRPTHQSHAVAVLGQPGVTESRKRNIAGSTLTDPHRERSNKRPRPFLRHSRDCMRSATLATLLGRLAPASDRICYYDPGNMDELGAKPSDVTPGKFAPLQTILVPLCLNQHWFLVGYNLSNSSVYRYDSMHCRLDPSKVQNVIAAIGTAIWSASANYFMEHWAETVLVRTPQQASDYDCGVCTVIAALHVTYNMDFPTEYGPSYIRIWRTLLELAECGDDETPPPFACLSLLQDLFDEQGPVNRNQIVADLLHIKKEVDKMCVRTGERCARQNRRAAQLHKALTSKLQAHQSMLLSGVHNGDEHRQQGRIITLSLRKQSSVMQNLLDQVQVSRDIAQRLQKVLQELQDSLEPSDDRNRQASSDHDPEQD